jgi:methylmalonyl-CoA mutase
MDHPDPAKANELALIDLENGADALTLVTRKAAAARGFGVTIETVEDLDRALSGVMLDLIHLRLDAGGKGRAMAEHLITLAAKRGHKLSDLSLDLDMDPIGGLASTGNLAVEWSEVSAAWARC